MNLHIDKAVYGGAGLVRIPEGPDAGGIVFVPFTLPGETVETSPPEQRGSTAEATLVQILTASPDRVHPRCAHFGECGGCQYQHAAYPAQVAMKTAILRETLERSGLTSLPKIPPHSADPWGYRNRTRMRIAEIDGELRVGYNRRASNDFLAIRECPIIAPLLWKAAAALQHISSENTPAAHWLRNAVEVEFFTTPDETKLQMTVFARTNPTGFISLCERMKELVPELSGAGVSLLSSSTAPRRAQRPREVAGWSAAGLNYPTHSGAYWVSRGGFFQVNRFLIDKMIEIVTTDREGQIAWDLYAGVGLFSQQLSKRFKQVVAVEASAEDLTQAFQGPGKRAVSSTTVEFLRSAVIQRERPELIVMDPPRAGVGAEVCAHLAKIAAPVIVYVSCDPVTLARDLRDLTTAGYRIAELNLIDMFPQTFHLETVVVLRR